MTAKNKKPKSAAKDKEKDQGKAVSPSLLLADSSVKRRSVAQLRAACNKEQVRAIEAVGERLRYAREMNGWELTEAARRLGYENAGSLSRLESAKHITAIPLYIIPRAAQVYGVTTDYLHGLTDDLSLAPRLRLRRDVAIWLADEMERTRRHDIEAMLALQEKVELVMEGTHELVLCVEEVADAIQYLRDCNVVVFENMKGSSRVMRFSEKAIALSTQTAGRLARFKGTIKAASVAKGSVVNQMSFDLSSD